mmetsp:Transcript_63247/g.142526  ORF Transcript_63247/g.142526 Transcript_63247/m.142526 type:complete len:428 (-) Transcript_63247:74-1357(-)
MQGALWTCQYTGCRSSPEQIAALRVRRPEGFPHDEDPELRVCTVCRRLPLSERSMEDQLDEGFLKGIKEELASIEENEKNIQALSQVFRYYAKHAKQLSQVLCDFVTKQCFPWELIHALHLVDDILLMDNTGRYKAELTDRVQVIAVNSFRKVQSEVEKREVAKMIHTWHELKIFEVALLEAIREAIRSMGVQATRILEEARAADEDEEEAPARASPSPPVGGSDGGAGGAGTTTAPTAPGPEVIAKKRKVQEEAKVADVAPRVVSEKTLAVLERVLNTPIERPFELLGIVRESSDGHDIRKAYRRVALLIHPDKNPGMEARCQEALVKLQQGREQAESDLQRLDTAAENLAGRGGETRSAATAAAANAAMDSTFRCRYPDCELPPCKQCANGCCTRNITHCHMIARSKAGMQCFFRPPPRAWARNA